MTEPARARPALPAKIIEYLPAFAPWAARAPKLSNALCALATRLAQHARGRPTPSAPKIKSNYFQDSELEYLSYNNVGYRGELLLLIDTFNRWFEPNNVRAAIRLLSKLGYRIKLASISGGRRALEQTRVRIDTLARNGTAVVALDPQCLTRIDNERFSPACHKTTSGPIHSIEQFLVHEVQTEKCSLSLGSLRSQRALLLEQDWQLESDSLSAAEQLLRMIPELELESIQLSSEQTDRWRRIGANATRDPSTLVVVDSFWANSHYARSFFAGSASSRSRNDTTSGGCAVHIARVLEASLTRYELALALKLS